MSPRTRGLPPDDLLDFTVELEWRLVIEGHGLTAILADVERVDPEPGSDRGGDFALSDLLAAHLYGDLPLASLIGMACCRPKPNQLGSEAQSPGRRGHQPVFDRPLTRAGRGHIKK